MSSSTNSEKIIVEFQKKIEYFDDVKQLTVVEKKEIVLFQLDQLTNLCPEIM